ncbi:MAG TPA: alpha/beta fold hydrolase [Longimicrobium sp.]|nr:alpha/beta fold hydrolase [Longimicrobium sp.]
MRVAVHLWARSPDRHPAVVQANGLRMEYDTFGDPSHPALLLVMGLAGQMVAWDEEFCARLAGCGFHVIRFDNRDMGRSTWMDGAPVPSLLRVLRAARRGEHIEVPYRVPDLANDTLALLDALGVESAHLVGISMGGMIAQTMAMQAPHRVRTLTSIMSHTGEPDLPHPHRRATASLLVPAPRNREMAMRRAVSAWRILTGPAIPLARADAGDGGAGVRPRPQPAGVLRQLAGIIASPSRAPGLRTLRVPTLVIHGEHDPLVPLEGGHRTAALVPGAELAIIPRMGHALPPPLWERLIELIARHASRG